MSYVLNKPFVLGRFHVNVVSRQVVGGHIAGRHGIVLHCSKTPVFVLVHTQQHTVALDMTGANIPLKDVHALCRDVVAL